MKKVLYCVDLILKCYWCKSEVIVYIMMLKIYNMLNLVLCLILYDINVYSEKVLKLKIYYICK